MIPSIRHKMQKRRVSKKYYLFTTLLYVVLCLSGLLWQFITISINYFEYHVLSAITIMVPGEESASSINMCFNISEVAAYEIEAIPQILELRWKSLTNLSKKQLDKVQGKLRKIYGMTRPHGPKINAITMRNVFGIVNENLTLSDYFKLALPIEYFDTGIGGDKCKLCKTYPYVIGDKFCYLATNLDNTTYSKSYTEQIFHASLQEYFSANYSKAFLSSPDSLPNLELLFSSTTDLRKGDYLEMSAYSYKMSKLKAPFSDNCNDYTGAGVYDWDDQVYNCSNEITTKNFSYVSTKKTFFQGQDYRVNFKPNQTLERLIDGICRNKYPRVNCEREITFTDVKSQKYSKNDISANERNLLTVAQTFSDMSSFEIKSYPKTIFIDYLTFVFGCLGTWLGFSFLGINPIPHIMTKDSNQVSPMDLQSEQINHKNFIRQMKKFMLNMHTTMFAMETMSKKEIEGLKIKHNQLISFMKTSNVKMDTQEKEIADLKKTIGVLRRDKK